MQANVKVENWIHLHQKPVANSFFLALAETQQHPKQETPFQRFKAQMKQLEQVVQRGDIKSWQEKFSALPELAKSANIDLEMHLEYRVQIKQWEFTLLLKASQRAEEQVTRLEKEINAADLRDDEEKLKMLQEKSQRMKRFVNQLREQLLVKLG
ncbi:MAG: hypothetical protein JNK65_04080 [Deltaproteobacteria bacterium]|nr:hypothetical protein [Deltaproteobacteria bacterium]